MGRLTTLASDTVIYGLSTILSRLIGWLMMPLYVRIVSQAVYGTFSYVYSFIAILLVLCTLGFETGYFRFATADNRTRLLGSLSRAVLAIGTLLVVAAWLLPGLVCDLLDFDFGQSSGTFALVMCAIVAVDSYNAIFFAELRYLRRSVTYALLRLLSVCVTVALTVFALCYLRHQGPAFAAIDDVTYMMLANLLGSLSSTIYFLPRIAQCITQGDRQLLRNALIYSLPLVGMGILGQANMNIEKILIKHLDPTDAPLASLGIYAACYKIGVLMSIFTQSFRLAFEPFVFKAHQGSDDRQVYAASLKWFTYFGLLIFMGVMLFLPLLKLLLPADYHQGLVIIPWILIGQLFYGVYYSMSLWYKLTDRTWWGMVMSGVGLAVNTALNFILIPRLGYPGAAISTFAGYSVMMLLSYFLGQHYFRVPYPTWRLVGVTVATVVLTFGVLHIDPWPLAAAIGLALFFGLIYVLERREMRNLAHKWR